MVEMKNNGTIFGLFKFADLQSYNHYNSSGVRFGSLNDLFVEHSAYKMFESCKILLKQ